MVSLMQIPNIMYDYAKSWPAKEYRHLSPSSLGGCMRSHFYKLKGVPMTTPPNPGALLNFELGRQWEIPVAKALRSAGVPFIEQLYLKSEALNMAGTLDVALFDVEEDEWELCSIKTESVFSSQYRKREGKSFFESNPDYAVQEAAYKLLMEDQGFKVKDKARYLVITKDNGFLDEPLIIFSEKLMTYTQQRIAKLNKYLEDDELPPCECEGWKIQYCNYGEPTTLTKNKKGKTVNSECCDDKLIKEIENE